jgi:uncharacterized membrane protein YciS (DUF1049 family)
MNKYNIIVFVIIIIIVFSLLLTLTRISKFTNYNNQKYIKFNNIVSEGLSHQTSNLMASIKEANYTNKILILPILSLSKKHNKVELKSNLSKYYNFDKLMVNNKIMKVEYDDKNINPKLINELKIQNELFRKDKLLKYDRNKKIYIDLPYNINIINISNKIIENFGKYCCIHIRRGDMLRLKKNLDKDTQSENIMRIIKKYKFDCIYIMTNESNLSIYNNIKSKYKVYFYTDFAKLIEEQRNDNYYLFCIEKNIMENANIRISTFKTKGDYYNNFLSNIEGSQ